MRSIGMACLALALIGCGSVSTEDTAALNDSDGGTRSAYAAAIAVPACTYNAQMGSISVTACDPSTSVTIDTGIQVAGDGGADLQAVISYYACAYQYTGSFAQKCIAEDGVNSFVRLTAEDPSNRAFVSIGYCVDSCPAAK
jgi:hypothetical protein